MTPTPEQSAIILESAALDPPALFVEAGPGCAKSTTIGLATKALPAKDQTKTLCLAFNKEIVRDLSTKVSSLAKVQTFNSLGLSAFPIPTNVDFRKPSSCINHIRSTGKYSIAPDEIDFYKALLSLARSQGYLPRQTGLKSHISWADLVAMTDHVAPTAYHQKAFDEILMYSIKQAMAGQIDFDDQLYMPAFFHGFKLPSYKYVFVDEAQDLNPVQAQILLKMSPDKIIFVGDPNQAIYAFRGAFSDAFEHLKSAFPIHTTLPLKTSFRVPKSVLPILQTSTPDLVSSSPYEGKVFSLETSFSLPEILPEGQTRAILCRNNAPLYRAALACIYHKIPFNLADTSFGESLIKDIRQVTARNALTPTEIFKPLIALWTSRGAKNIDFLRDKAQAINGLITATQPSTTDALCLTIKSLLQKSNTSDKAHPVFLSTAHRAKGLEFWWILHLSPSLIPSLYAKTEEDFKQESNIAYVINSRPRHTLVFAEAGLLQIGPTEINRRRPDTASHQPI